MNFSENPIAEEKGDAFRNELLIIFAEGWPLLNSLNKEPVTDEEKEEAKKEKDERTK